MSPPFPQPQSGWQYAQSSPGASAMPDLSLQQFVQFDQFVRFKLFKFLFAVTWNLTFWKSKFRSIFDAMRHWTGGYVVSFAQKSEFKSAPCTTKTAVLWSTPAKPQIHNGSSLQSARVQGGSTVDLFVIGKAHSEIPLAPRMWRATRQKVGQKNAKHMNFFQITELLLHSSQLSVDPWSSETGHIGHQHLCAIRPPKRGQKKPSWPSQLFLVPSLRTWRAALDPKCSQQNLTANELPINFDKCPNLWRFWQSQLFQSKKKETKLAENKNLHQLPTPRTTPPPNPDLAPSSSTSGQCRCTNVHVEMTSLSFFRCRLVKFVNLLNVRFFWLFNI